LKDLDEIRLWHHHHNQPIQATGISIRSDADKLPIALAGQGKLLGCLQRAEVAKSVGELSSNISRSGILAVGG
jgi:hypothetical protein